MTGWLSESELIWLQRYIAEQTGIVVGDDKHYLLQNRMSKLLDDYGISSHEQLIRVLRFHSDKEICSAFVDAMTVNETLWFRDKSMWQVIENVILPRYVKELRQGIRQKVRLWSAACSTGQEPYSLAICIINYLHKHGIHDVSLNAFEILASDVSQTILEAARCGVYDSLAMSRGLDELCRGKHFQYNGNGWEIAPDIKAMVHFFPFNLQHSLVALGYFDMILCRYVTIYFSEEMKQQVLQRIAQQLHPQGLLLLGNSEIFSDYHADYEMEICNCVSLFRKQSKI